MTGRILRPSPTTAIVWAGGDLAATEEAVIAASVAKIALDEPRLDARAADRLARAGATHARLGILGSQVSLHELHAGPGDFGALVTTLAALRGRGIELAAWTALTRSSVRSLSEMPAWLAAQGVRAWMVCLPRLEGEGPWTRATGRLGLVVPLALAALERARTLGLEAYVSGAPLCTLGPFAARHVSSPARAYGAGCPECSARNQCCGVEKIYLERFGAGELHAVAPVAELREPPWIFAGLHAVIEPSLRVRS